jgi:hypothetical protein
MRINGVNNCLLDAAAVGYDRSRFKMGHGLFRNQPERLDRSCQKDHICVLDTLGQVLGKAIDNTQPQGRLQIRQASANADNMTHCTGLFKGQGERTADQTHTNNSQPININVSHNFFFILFARLATRFFI